MIGNAIQSLMKYHNRVNIPNLGAVIRQQDFSQSIFFNQFIRHDDGLLMQHLIRVESLTEDEARDVLAGFVSALQKSVNEQGGFEVDGLGIFCMIHDRLELLDPKEFERHTSTKVLQHDTVQASSDAVVAVEPLPMDTPDVPEEPESADTTHDISPVDGVALLNTGKQDKYSSKTILFIAGLIIPVPLLAVYLIQKQRHVEHSVYVDVAGQSAAVSTAATTANLVTENLPHPSDTTALAGTSASNDLPSSNSTPDESCHIIIGSFLEESNATKMVEAQRQLGYDVRIVATRHGFHLVGFSATGDVTELKRQCETLQKNFPGAWIGRW